ncbi:MAG: NAD(P)-dependent oxidoreductase [Candidatus Dormibacteraeota bacterium]|nr:NAD(P)-dependent oxidoreductase [Candidatus Dormibacteraeota bacterium]MBO0762164.1 NAD(P)-dependent oxidoreductase [Candidatus Dormibacteraeota bacterium]
MQQPGEVVGFIGLGVMGGPMAANLARSGYQVVGCDPDPRRRQEAQAAGVYVAGSPAEVAQDATRTLISIVRDVSQTWDVLYSPQGVIAPRRAGLDLVVMSTLDPGTMARLAEDLGQRGITAVAAPVSGGRAGAEQRSLSIMTSGDRGALDRVEPVLHAMGSNVFRLGEGPAMAQAAKLANQLMLATNIMGVQEGLEIASAHGVDESQLMSLLTASTGGSWVTEHWAQVERFTRGHQPGDELDIILKDLRSTLREADESEMSLPVTAVTFQRLRQAWRRGR